jgi:hypothetical protein
MPVRLRLCLCAVAVALILPATASATISSVFGTISCQVQPSGATAGQRWCTDTSSQSSLVPSWDGTPIDVSVAFPPAAGTDRNWPVVGIFVGWGASKIEPPDMQRWLGQGFAVFSITPRGFGNSCGGSSSNTLKTGACVRGYLHLMADAYEVRDVQYLLGRLADQGVIDPQRIGAIGLSYGGGMSIQLGALKDRTMLPDHSLIPWVSPVKHLPMRIAATAPEFPWTDLLQSLMPNGSGLDYVADSPYQGPLGDHRLGIEKQNWVDGLFVAGTASAYVDPTSDGDPAGNLQNWYSFDSTGGPYDGTFLGTQELTELPYHSAYYTNLSEPPAPALMSAGWNDDLFPVDETVRYYNKVRSAFPNTPMQLFDFDFGHFPRVRAPYNSMDGAKLKTAENVWFNYYVKGQGTAPANADGGVTAMTTDCTGGPGTEYDASNWASLAQGEIRLDSPAQQQVSAPGTPPANSFTTVGVCTSQGDANNPSAAEYTLPATPNSFTIAGSPTVIADISAPGANDQLIARLYDDNVSAGTELLIGRAIYRPLDPGGGFTKQVFQLHPQAWQVPAGHVLKLELLSSDSPYARDSSSPDSIQVQNLELRVPTVDPPGSDGGLVQTPLPKYLPPGYKLAEGFMTTVPGVPQLISGSALNASGQFTLGWSASEAAADLYYTLQHRDGSGSGWSDVNTSLSGPVFSFASGSSEAEGTWTYRVYAHQADGTLATDFSGPSAPVKVDLTPPNAPSLTPDRPADYAGGGGWWKDSVTVTATGNGDPALRDGSSGSGVNPSSIPAPSTHSASGTYTDVATATDNAGNQSAQTSLTVQVDATAPALSVTCPAIAPLGAAVTATVTASDGESGLAADPSGQVPIDTSSAGNQTVTRTATDNVGHSVTRSCTTQVVSDKAIFSSTNPVSDSNNASPLVLGLAEAGSTVRLYATSDCSGTPVGTGSASTFASTGIAVSVAHDTTTVLRATVSDAGGTSACSTRSISYLEDSTPPSISITSHPSARTPSGSATLAFSANEGATFQCRLDSGSFASCSSPLSYSSLTPGQHTFQVQGTDLAGNTSNPVSFSWTIDQSPPSISIVTPAGGSTYALGQVVASSYSCSDPDGPGDVATCVGPVASGAPLATSTTGPHTFSVGAIDRAGNIALASPSYTVYAADGSGTLGVAPKLLSASAVHQTVTLTYMAATGGLLNGALSVVVPVGWSAPSTVATAPGYTISSRGTVSAAGQTITVSGLTLLAGQRVRISYGSTAGGGPGATAPSTPAGAQTWQAQEQSVAGSNLTSLTTSPAVTVYAADGSGSLSAAPASVPHTTSHTITLTYTVPSGGIAGGALTVAVPAGWSPPSLVSTAPGYTTTSRGRLSVLGQLITITGLTRTAGQTITITYGRRVTGGGPGASAPSGAVGAQTWQCQEKSTAAGILTSLVNPPKITVT